MYTTWNPARERCEPHMIKKLRHHPFAMATILCWALSYVLSRLVLPYISSSTLGLMRCLIASAVVGVTAIVTKMKPPKKSDLLRFLIAGGFGFFLYMIAFNRGMETVSSSTGSVVIATVPLITALLARVVYKEKLQPFQWAATGIEFAGVLLLTLINGIFSINTGLFWLFFAALSLSVYNLLQRKITQSYSALQSSSYSIFGGTLLLMIFLPDAVNEMAHIPPVPLLCVIIMGVFSSAVGYITWSMAFARAEKTSQVSNYMFFTPFITSILGFIIAGEIPDSATVLGGAVILLGVFIYNFGGRLLPTKNKST